jgi:hypothetical protein
VNKLAVIVLLIGLAACSQKPPEEGREPAQTATPGAVVGSATGAPAPGSGGATTGGAAATGAAAGGSAATTGAAAGGSAAGSAAPAPGMGCAIATALVCDAGQSDGCAGGLTSVHVCVAKDAKAGPPCAQEVAMTCPAGQADACLQHPPQANNHVCVIVPKLTP